MLQVIPHPLIQSALGQTASTFIPSNFGALDHRVVEAEYAPCAQACGGGEVKRIARPQLQRAVARQPGSAPDFLSSGACCVGVANPKIQKTPEVCQDPRNG